MLCADADGSLRHGRVGQLPAHVSAGDVVVVNDTRVRPCRLTARKDSGGAAEVLVLEHADGNRWHALVRASRSPREGQRLLLPGGVSARVCGRAGAAFVLDVEGDLDDCLERHGAPPLPPYIDRPFDDDDRARYQTTFARRERAPLGSPGAAAAAPTAGLHLTADVVAAIERRGARVVRLALGVGAGTFRPVNEDRVEDHLMHEEPFEVPAETAAAVNAARAEGRVILAIGTTTLRALEAAVTPGGRVRAVTGRTGLFVTPGTPIRTATRLLTNFHQPGSTLLALVQAFAGGDVIRAVHQEAAAEGYRLFSYGDCMLLARAA